jgi:hypothetical protein
MTCHRADRLIEDVLNGDANGEAERGLRDHLGQCETCSEAWRTAWQVRSALNRCPASDPGDSYFRLATARIMARVEALGAEVDGAEPAPAVGSARYGPLQVRGVGLLFAMLLGCLLDGVALPAARAVPASGDRAGDLEQVPCLEAAELPQPIPPAAPADPASPCRPLRPLHREPFQWPSLSRLSSRPSLPFPLPLPVPCPQVT